MSDYENIRCSSKDRFVPVQKDPKAVSGKDERDVGARWRTAHKERTWQSAQLMFALRVDSGHATMLGHVARKEPKIICKRRRGQSADLVLGLASTDQDGSTGSKFSICYMLPLWPSGM